MAIFTPMYADLYGSKGVLALLSDEQYRDRYTAEELASLDRIVQQRIRPTAKWFPADDGPQE